MRLIPCLLLGAWLAASAHAGTRVLPPGAVLVAPAAAKADPAKLAVDAGAVLERVARGDAAGAFAQLQAIDDPVAAELTAARVIDAVMQAPGGSGDRLLAALEGAPVRVFLRHEETAADWFVPLVDVAARAKSARRVIAANAARDRAVAMLSGDAASAPSIDPAVLPEAIAALPQKAADDLSARVAGGDVAMPGPALAQLAARSARPPVWMTALQKAEPIDVLPLFALVDTRLPGADALDWLHAASKDPRYASAAVLATGRMAKHSIAAFDQLAFYLDRTDTGPSAAAAFAQDAGASFVSDIDRLLAKTSNPIRVQHLALALRLADTPEATRRLHALRDDPRLPAGVKAELQR